MRINGPSLTSPITLEDCYAIGGFVNKGLSVLQPKVKLWDGMIRMTTSSSKGVRIDGEKIPKSWLTDWSHRAGMSVSQKDPFVGQPLTCM